MAKISGKETKPEIMVRKYLFSKGYRYLKNVKALPGSPDIVLKKYKTIIFIHGCFWHGHNCNAGKLPKTRKDFWTKKIYATIVRDKKNKTNLGNHGWDVITIWQCELRKKDQREKMLDNIIIQLTKNRKIDE